MYISLTQTPDDSVSDHGKITRIELGHVRLRHAEEQARNYVITINITVFDLTVVFVVSSNLTIGRMMAKFQMD